MGYTDFFQSQEFASLQEKIPYRGKTWALKARGGSGPAVTCLVIRQKIRFGKCFFWIPYGPVFLEDSGNNENDTEKSLGSICEDLSHLAKKENAIFSRIEPPADISKLLFHSGSGLKKFSFRGVRKPFANEHSLVIDLSLPEEELLKQMREKGRYNLKLAERNRVTVQRFDDTAAMGGRFAFDEFYKLLAKTAGKQGFRAHPKSFYETLLGFLGPKKMASLFVAQHEGKIVGGVLIIWYGDTATYYYGASSYANRALQAPYLLHFMVIREAKQRGLKYYDFFGTSPPDNPSHHLAGVTEFKKKFGGFEVKYGRAIDLVHKPIWYFLYRLFS